MSTLGTAGSAAGDLSRFSINQMTVKQLSMPELVDACLELGIVAAERRDGIAWLTAADADKVEQHIANERKGN